MSRCVIDRHIGFQRKRRLFLEPLEDRSLLATIVVTGTGDTIAVDGLVTLREAITSANNNANVNADVVAVGAYATETINFNIAGAGVRTITPVNDLPGLTGATIIDGYSQPGASANTNPLTSGSNAVILIELNGSALGAGVNDGLQLASDSTVRGLAINRFGFRGIVAFGTGNVIAGNFVGTDATGSLPRGNQSGVVIQNFGVGNNRVGGTDPGDRNVISGNTSTGVSIIGSSNTVQGNFIGTNAASTASDPDGTPGNGDELGNGDAGIVVGFGTNNAVGGTIAGAGNVVAGNASIGINLGAVATSNFVQGNFVGTNPAGANLGNGGNGIEIGDANNVVGGLTPGAGNVIGNNAGNGILVAGSGTLIQGNFIGTNPAGANLGNAQDGVVLIRSNSTLGGTAPAAANVIAFNLGNGVDVVADNQGPPTGDSILGNHIFANVGLGIDLNDDGVTPNDANDPDTGPNRRQNFPVITLVQVQDSPIFINSVLTSIQRNLHIEGTLNSTPGSIQRIEFFASDAADPSGFGEGQRFLGAISITDNDNNGNFSFTFDRFDEFLVTDPPPPYDANDIFTATATNSTTNDTSEFSAVQVASAGATATTTMVETSGSPSVFGQSVTFTATVSGADGTPTGSVTFVDTTTATTLGTDQLDGSGEATLSVNNLGVGTHVIQATYSGDVNFNTSSDTVTQTVNQATTTTNLTTSPDPSDFGQSVTLTATVSSIPPSTLTPVGSVTFVDTTTGTNLGTDSLDGSGVASLSTNVLTVGPHSIQATYNPSANFSSSSDTDSQVVNQATVATTTTLGSSDNNSIPGQPVTFTATVSATVGGIPTGTVTFRIDGGSDVVVALNGSGQAAFSTSTLSVGPHIITANYTSNSANFDNSAAPPLTQTVSQVQTTTTLASSDSTSDLGQSVTFTATVSAPEGGIPTGTVTFRVDGGSDLVVSLSGSGQASFTTSTLTVGAHTITADYTSNSIVFLNSAAPPLTQTVTAPAADLSVTKTGASTVVAGQNITYTLKVTNNGPADAQNVVVADMVPANTTFAGFIGISQGTGIHNAGLITANFGTVTVGTPATLTFMVTTDASIPNGTIVTNTATATSDTPDPNVANNTGTKATRIGPPGLPECEVITLNLPGATRTAVLQDDADNPGQNVLLVTGTSKGDVIVIEPRPVDRSQIRVKINGQLVGIFTSADVQHIVAFGLTGNDKIVVNATLLQLATLFGNEGDDYLYGAKGTDGLDGGNGADRLFGGLNDDTLCGGNGNDFVYGQAGNDLAGGDAGNDKVYGEGGNDFLLGNDGNDKLVGGIGNDRMFGQAGNDQLFGEPGNDIAVGGDGNDKLFGDGGRDVLIGGDGLDLLFGEGFDDILVAGSTAYDQDDAALQSILAEWTSANNYTTRVNNIRFGGGANGAFVLDGTAVIDDGVKDTLYGDGGLDWFLFGDGDKLKDKAATELVN